MLERTLGEHIELHLDLAATPQQSEQIVLSLAVNARDAMAHGGRLTISTASSSLGRRALGRPGRRGGEVVLRVADTGHGMEPDVLSRAFEAFATTKPRGQGTGPGIATVYGIVRCSDGDVSIESASGSATVVTVILSRTTASTPEGRAGVTEPPGGRERILLVEDKAALRGGTERMSAHGDAVLVASDGFEALEAFDRERPAVALVLTDVVMPRMRGDAPLTRRLLSKPVSEEGLLRAVREMLDGTS